MFGIRSMILAAVGAAGTMGAFGGARSMTPVPLSEEPASYWTKRLAECGKAIAKGGAEVVFLGDAQVHFFNLYGNHVWDRYWASEPYRALNLGFSADATENLLWRITEGRELDGYEAKAIVLEIGKINISHRGDSPAAVIAGVKKILAVIREKQPKATVILSALFPRGEKPDHPFRAKINAVNRELQKYADGRKVVWCDISDRFLLPDGRIAKEMMVNSTHLTEEGYLVWTAALLPYVNAILKGETMALGSTYPVRGTSIAEAGAIDAVFPVTRIRQKSWRGEDWWGDRLSRNLDVIAGMKGEVDLVFAGDSITHFWEDYGGKEYAALTNRYRIVNLGYGGDQTQNLLWRFRNGELDGYRAKAVMMMIGTNNNGIGGYDPANTAKGIKACLDVIREKQPQAKILLMAPLPRAVGAPDFVAAKTGAHLRNLKTKEIIRGFADGKRIFYFDIGEKFLDRNGAIPKALMGDQIHPTERGYALWREAMEPEFKKAVGR